MFNFNNITHVIENPKGHAPGYNYSLVGAVPASLMEARKPTISDIMGGRVQKDGLAYATRKWETVEAIKLAAERNGITLCQSPDCACRKLF